MSENMPWERKSDEPHRWFQRFEAFRLMGPGRTLNSAFFAFTASKSPKKPKYLPGSWKRSAQAWSWFARAEAWDQHLIDERKAAVEAAQAAADALWREKHMRDAEALARLAEIGRANPADFITREPQAITRGSGDDEETIYIESASLDWGALKERGYLVKKISFNQYGPIIEMKDSSGAIEKIGENLNLWRQAAGANLNIDLSQLTDEQLERIANGEDPIAVMATSSAGRA